MRKLGVLLVLIVVGMVAYKLAFPSVSVRYRITTVAELDGKQSSGLNVMEVTYYKNVQLLGVSSQMQIGIRGDATPIDFGDRRLLVVLLARGVILKRAASALFIFCATKKAARKPPFCNPDCA